MAFDGTNYLVVWGDGPSGDIYAARVTRQGEVLDPGGFPVTTAPRTQSHPKVAFDGTNYLVAWTDDRNDVPSGNQDVYAARVTPSGTVLDPAGIPVVGGADYYESAGDVVFGGQNFLVVWNSSWRYPPYTMSVGSTLIDRQGTVVRSASFESEGRYPVAAFDGTNYLAAWADVRNEWDVVVSRVSQAGDVLDPGGLDISNNMWFQSYTDLAFDGTNYLAVWEDGRNGGGPSKIYGTRVTPGAVALDPAGIPISTRFGGPFAPAVAFGGANFLAGWTDNRDFQGHLWGSRISPAGTVLDPDGFAFNTLGFDDRDLAIGFDGTNYLAVWTDNPNQDAEIYGTRIAQDGTILDPNRIPRVDRPAAASSSTAPASASATSSAATASASTTSTAAKVPRPAPDRPSFGAGQDPHPDEPLLGRLGSADPREARPRDRGRPVPVGRGNPETWIPRAPDRRPALIRMVRSRQEFR